MYTPRAHICANTDPYVLEFVLMRRLLVRRRLLLLVEVEVDVDVPKFVVYEYAGGEFTGSTGWLSDAAVAPGKDHGQ